MKYAKTLRPGFALALACTLGACALNPSHNSLNETAKPQVELVQTEQYLPVLELGESGRPLPYSAAPNPYELQEGKIEADAVKTYIAARRAFDRQAFSQADTLLAELVQEYPKLSGPVVLRGDIALERELLSEAMDFYKQAIAVNKLNMNAYIRLAKVQRMEGQFKHAQNTYAQALAIWPDGAELHLNLGVLYDLYLNEPLKAQAHMEAYQFLTGDNSGQVVAWLEEIRGRTGVAMALGPANGPAAQHTADGNASGDELAATNVPVAQPQSEE